MRFVYILSFLFFTLVSFAQEDSITYPQAPKADIKDTIWGEVVNDPYRTLETDNTERKEWLNLEDQLTKSYFKKHKDKLILENDYETIAKSSYNIPSHQGRYYIEWIGNSQNGVVSIYSKKSLQDDNRELLLSPTSIDKGLKRFSSISMSSDGHYLAYAYSKNGSDWQEIGVYDIENDKILKDHIQNIKFSDINWLGNGFYYSRFDSVNENGRYLDVQKNQKVYYHVVGTQNDDQIIYENKENPLSTFRVQTIGDKFLVIGEGDRLKLMNVKENGSFNGNYIFIYPNALFF
jgi:prolyl oligopeptidase